ncbi:MAG: DUF1295 domain-containing protein [Bacteroidales bacterium]|nr:DUF1295 domain-containing protein [Bacteroidales bacterium]MBN2763228.1 DUF1295 domain-containing protein [Bacteroidales bacterium]
METLAGFLAPALIYLYIFILNAVLPGRWFKGYINGPHSDEKLKYRLNGLLVLATVIMTWVLLCRFGVMDWNWLYAYRWQGLAGAAAIGLVFSFAMVLPYPRVKRFFLADFYLGRLDNPRLWGGRIDAKMWLYLTGAVMLELNVLSFTAHHYIINGPDGSPGVYLTAALLTFFVIDYLTFEKVHLYTYDIFAEKVGFKLGFGCLTFYPYFYAIPLWVAVGLPDAQTPTTLLVVFAIIFFTGWTLARGANMQKYYFKKDPKQAFLGIQPGVITDGNKTVLANGFWGLSRHINYLGEITMAVGIVLCTGHADRIWPWLYPLYYIALLLPRQIADDKRCALKYGTLWDQYRKKVPYRIIPWVY